jgi:hypothetical protein
MKIAGNFNIKDYLERLYEEAEAKGPTQEVEGLLLPEENKKSFSWLKKEYEKGKTEVKVEMNMGGSKFQPGYDLQTNLKSVKDFKPGMFGDVKTSDNEGSKKKEEGTEGGENKQPSFEKGKKPFEKGGEKPEGKKGGASVKDGEAKEGESKEGKKKGADVKDAEVKEKKKKFESYEIVQDAKGDLKEVYEFLSFIPMSAKPEVEDLFYSRKIKVDNRLEEVLGNLPVINFNTYESLLENWGSDSPLKKEKFFIANVLEESGVSFLVRPEQYDYAKYIVELI